MKFLLFLATVSSFLVIRINGYSGGAPAFKCNDMTPSHSGIQPDISTPPYTLLASSTTYKQGETITLTLRSTTGASFVGFMIAAKDRTTLSTIHGRFLNFAAGQVLNCGSSNAGSATHTNKQPRYTVQVQWQPTADTTGDVVFLATVVESYTVFWINIMTPGITEAPSVVFTTEPPTTTQKVTTTKVAETPTNPVTSTTTPVVVPQTTSTTTTTTNTITSTQAQLGKLSPDNECGATKGCFTKCSGQSCTYIVTWRDNVDTVDFELATTLTNTDNKWIGIAFSTDLKMGGDEVVACTNIGGNTDINRSYNDGKNNQAVGDPKIGLSNTAVSIQNGVFKCSFSKQKRIRRQKRQAANSLFVDLENDYNIMFGTGSAYIDSRTGSARNGMHSVNPDITPGKVDFQSFSYIGDTAKHPLVKIHACLMIIAWIFCTSIAIISARYYKPVWSKTSLFNQKVWFQIHRTLMVTAMALTVVAFIIIFVEVGGYSEVSASLGKEYLPAHPILGIIVTILCILNPIMSLFRPAPDDKKRPIFNWAHWGVGMAAQILAIITIIFGVELQKSTAPKYTVWVVVGFVIYYVLMEIIQKVVDRLLERKTEGHPDAVEMKQNGATITQPPAYSASDKNRKDTLLKKSLLALHVICTFAFTLTLLLLVSMY